LKNNLVLSSDKRSLEINYCNIFPEDRILIELEEKPVNYFVADEILFNNKDRVESFNICEQIYKSILNDLYLKLNEIHKIQWNKKSWEILIGFWLKRFIYIIFFKFNNLNHILENKKIDKVSLSKSKTNHLTSHESTQIQNLSIDTNWSWILYSKIFEYLKTENIEIDIFENEKENFHEDHTLLFERVNINKKNIKKKIIKSYNFLTNRLLSHKRNFIVGTYLPILEEKKLELLFGQIPTFYRPPYIKYSPINLSFRKSIFFNKDCLIKEKIVRDLLPSYLPTFILENFQILKSTVEKYNYPQKPKFIFTSNIFESDEAFKYYLANIINQVEKPKYFVGQHGNAYFTRIDNNFRTEVKTCDYFISWGEMGYNNKKMINLFNLKLPHVKKKKNVDKIVIVFRSLGYQDLPYDRWKEGKEELLMTKNFIKCLSNDLHEYIYLRLHASFKNRYKTFIQDYLSDIKDFKKDFEEISFNKLTEDAKLVVFNYDSTGFLDNLTSGKPSMCLYPNIFNHLNQNCKQHYKNLKDANIIFDDPKEMSDHINNIWPNVNQWWNSNEIQRVIENFSKAFSIPAGKNPLRLIKETLVEKII
jgi:putative transferase (TIGR04331 family)